MGFSDLLIENEGKIRIIRINRPEVLNALREETFHEFEEVFGSFSDDDSGVMIITGVGDRAFSAGGDVKALEKMTSREAADFARLAHRVLDKMENQPKPIIAAVNGFALGAGCDLAVACDLIVASEKAVFGEPPSGLGITTPFGGTQRLPRIIGSKRAKHIFFTGDFIDADTAYQFGLVNKVVKYEELMSEVMRLATKIITKAPISIGFLKQLVNMCMTGDLNTGDEMEIDLYAKCFETEDKKEGIRAFIEKRKPVFRGI